MFASKAWPSTTPDATGLRPRARRHCFRSSGMIILVYFLSAFSLMLYCISPTHRAKCHERWKKTPTHRVIYEVGGGIIGLIGLGAIVTVIIVSPRK
jgi:hypothetical protein